MDMALSPSATKERKERRMADWLIGKYNSWGKPAFDINSSAFWEMVTDIIRVWGEWYHQEYLDMIHNNRLDKRDEKSLSELTNLKNSVVYPKHFYLLMKWMWPDARMASQGFSRKFGRKFPIFRNSNYT